MTLYLQQKINKKVGKIGEILKFTFSTGLPKESALLFLVLCWISGGDSDHAKIKIIKYSKNNSFTVVTKWAFTIKLK